MRFASIALAILLVSPVHGQTESEKELFDKSMALFRQAKFEEMIAGCDAAIEKKEFAALATGLKAIAYSEMGDNTKATETATSATEMSSGSDWQLAMLYSCLGYIQVRQGLHQDALVSAEKAIELADNAPFPIYVKMFVYYHRGQFPESIDLANECLERNEKFALALMLRGDAEANSSQSKEAYLSMVAAMQVDPNYVQGAWLLALYLANNGDTERAHAVLDAAEHINKNYYAIHTTRGVIYQMEGEIEKMEECVVKAYQLNDRNIEPITSYGYFLIQQERLDEAEPVCERCVERYPNNYHSFLMRGFLLSKQGKIDESIKNYQQCLELNPTQLRPMLMQGITYFVSERFEEAVEVLLALKKKNPKDWFGVMTLGQAYAKLGQHKKAIEEFTIVLDLVDDYGTPYAERAYSYEAIGEAAKAESDFEKAKELGWDESWRDQ